MSDKQQLGPRQKSWVAELRSGHYQQAKAHLAIKQFDGSLAFCCLGVACEVAGIKRSDSPVMRYLGETNFVPKEGQEYYGLHNQSGCWAADADTSEGKPNLEGSYSLAGANDNGATFEAIAGFIEAHPELIFKEAR